MENGPFEDVSAIKIVIFHCHVSLLEGNHGYFKKLWGKRPHPGSFRGETIITSQFDYGTGTQLLTSINRWPKLWHLPVTTICNIDAGPLLRPKKRPKTTNHDKSRDRIDLFCFTGNVKRNNKSIALKRMYTIKQTLSSYDIYDMYLIK